MNAKCMGIKLRVATNLKIRRLRIKALPLHDNLPRGIKHEEFGFRKVAELKGDRFQPIEWALRASLNGEIK